MQWPEWWDWEIELTPHAQKRMIQRGLTEIELRRMLSTASGYRDDDEPGRYVVLGKKAGNEWEVIIEPDPEERLQVVVTAYPTGE
jgi:hypothetical protein